MKIESSDTNIEHLFTSSFLVVPRFQRPYSWDDDNLEDFWRDTVQDAPEDYFIGSMVLYKSGRQQFGVVDGQQRLTTITILLCVIRDILKEIGEIKLAQGLHGLIQKTDRDSISRFVLKTETSYPFLQEKIQKFDDPDFEIEIKREEFRLEAAYKYFMVKTRELVGGITLAEAGAPDELREAKKNILTKLRDQVLLLRLIKVELENEDDAYLIFETLNTRGKDLALSDLLKNHFAKQIKARQDVDTVREQWRKLMENLSSAQIDVEPDTFFTHSWSSRVRTHKPV